MSESTDTRSRDFIREMVEEDLRTGKYAERVATRFPPEPNGYLHIGHAKSICLNFGLASEYSGHCNLRFDDTNPTTEDPEYVDSIQDDIHWLGFDWLDNRFFASDYFERLYGYAIELVEQGDAYVDSLSEAEIREYRGTVTEPGRNSPYRERGVEENLDLLHRMRAGEFADGEHVLRAKIDMAAANMKMRDPLLYRIRHAHHYRTGDDWCIYPMYDFAHCLSDAIEGITHSLCTLEFENNREIYDWILERTSVDRPLPEQTEFARLNLSYTVLSKRRLLELVEGGYVDGWDDPRMPTLSGLRRRGYTPASIRNFCDSIGVAKANSVVDVAQLEHAIRDDLNYLAPRLLCVLDPVKVVITNYPEGESELLEAPYFPADIGKEGSRPLPFSREILIERSDFSEEPPKGYRRMAPGREIRLRYAYIVRCEDVVRDESSGEIREIHCTYDPDTKGGSAPDGRKIAGTIHWVSAEHAVPIETRLYDRLFDDPRPDRGKGGPDFKEFLNPDSLRILTTSRAEPSVLDFAPGSHLQFERQGFFYRDPGATVDGPPVFNLTVGLRDTWEKRSAKTPTSEQPESTESPKTDQATAGAPRPLSGEEKDLRDDLVERFSLSADTAEQLARDPKAAEFFEATVQKHDNAASIANWIVNELRGEIRRSGETQPRLSPGQLAELVAIVDSGQISSKIAKELLAEMLETGEDPATLVERHGLHQISDEKELASIIERVLAEQADNVEAYRSGKTSLRGHFVGQVMKATGGRANPQLVQKILDEHLNR